MEAASAPVLMHRQSGHSHREFVKKVEKGRRTEARARYLFRSLAQL